MEVLSIEPCHVSAEERRFWEEYLSFFLIPTEQIHVRKEDCTLFLDIKLASWRLCRIIERF